MDTNIAEGEDRWVPEQQAALYLGVSHTFLQRDRVTEQRIPFVRIGRAVRYNTKDLRAFAERRKEGGRNDQ